MQTMIQMYRVDDYDNWHSAERDGAIYSVTVHSVDEPESEPGARIMADIMNAIKTTAQMMDGRSLIECRTTQGA